MKPTPPVDLLACYWTMAGPYDHVFSSRNFKDRPQAASSAGCTGMGLSLNHHLLCGEGEFDLRGIIASARAAGFNGPWGVEILL
jgi:hypothetical protein